MKAREASASKNESLKPFLLEALARRSRNVRRRMGSCSSWTLRNFCSPLHLDFRFEVVIKIGEDWKYEQDCVIRHSHPFFCIACAEDEHIENGGEEEDDEDCQGEDEGGLGHCHWIRWPTKLPGQQIFNDTEASPVDIQNLVVRMSGEADHVVHQTHYGHAQTVGMDQHLDINQSQCLPNAIVKPWSGSEQQLSGR